MSDLSVSATGSELISLAAMGPEINQHYALLRHVLERYVSKVPYTQRGFGMEFGVGGGTSTRIIAQYMPTVYGFDSFKGLPEDWREGFPKGSFAVECPPDLRGVDVRIVRGMFADTLPEWVGYQGAPRIGLLHIDCDLYSSTKTVFDTIGHLLMPGCVICFDEFHGFDTAALHEQRAWVEFQQSSGVEYVVLGHSSEQWAVQIV